MSDRKASGWQGLMYRVKRWAKRPATLKVAIFILQVVNLILRIIGWLK